ncbi:DNA adenine methylase [Periweissella fabalis]|uniref:Site-specific DNA-methyltransferase (adenine-specific) n=1 Tax=Periweissella fabalis TaxID=1070421 RepID=A0A7X6N0J3_9LACO|nr:DNA adenine methylase [Periweissella fabalis]MCM0599267.1 DNA adenine methylase [Periweissella fabalis]NKZ23546.1 DNA adenine methylase [Periweissella fabalis]
MVVKELEEEMTGVVVSPFIKWVGGKRQLLPQLIELLPNKSEINTYFEPFIGGGALFLRLQPTKAVINDFNSELSNTWEVVRDNPEELQSILSEHQQFDSKEYYLNLRSADRDERITKMTKVERAARFIYMNKAGYNGLWRVNSKGQNNVPYGAHKTLNLVNETIINDASYLQAADLTILTGDYKDAVATADTGDFVYFDPPYIPVTTTAAFTSYTADGFGLVQQEQLRDTVLALTARGVKVMLSNSDVPLIDELYSDPIFKIHRVMATRMVNSNGKGRGKVGEVIITNY